MILSKYVPQNASMPSEVFMCSMAHEILHDFYRQILNIIIFWQNEMPKQDVHTCSSLSTSSSSFSHLPTFRALMCPSNLPSEPRRTSLRPTFTASTYFHPTYLHGFNVPPSDLPSRLQRTFFPPTFTDSTNFPPTYL